MQSAPGPPEKAEDAMTKRKTESARRWSPEEIRLLRKYYPNHANDWIATRLSRKSKSIRDKAHKLALRKSAAYRKRLLSAGERA